MAKRQQRVRPPAEMLGQRFHITADQRLLYSNTNPLFDFNYTTPPAGMCDREKLRKGRCSVKLGFDHGRPVIATCNPLHPELERIYVANHRDAIDLSSQICPDSWGAAKSRNRKLTANLEEILADEPQRQVAGLRGAATATRSKQSCRKVGKLTAKKRAALPASAFGLPASRTYPMPDPSHARAAKARAAQQLKARKLSKAEHSRIVTKANRVIAQCNRR